MSRTKKDVPYRVAAMRHGDRLVITHSPHCEDAYGLDATRPSHQCEAGRAGGRCWVSIPFEQRFFEPGFHFCKCFYCMDTQHMWGHRARERDMLRDAARDYNANGATDIEPDYWCRNHHTGMNQDVPDNELALPECLEEG